MARQIIVERNRETKLATDPDKSLDLEVVNVGGTPKRRWDEDADRFTFNKGVSVGDDTNYADIGGTGDTVFVGGAGLPYGEIWFKDNANPTTLNSAAKVQITDFDNDGEEHNTDADHTNDHIVIQKAGRYLVTVSLTAANDAAQSHILNISCFKNNGAVELGNLHSHRSLTGGSGDVGSISISGIVNLAVDDTLELWATTNDAANRDVIFEDCTMSILMVGGPT